MRADMSSLLDRFASARALCLGDVMLDRFVYGRVDRISPEAPIPVFAIGEERLMLGGAGNVARNLAALGASVGFVSVIGADRVGREITAMIGREPAVTPYLVAESGRISTTKTRYVAGTQQVLRADHEVLSAVSDSTADRVLETALGEMAAHDVVVLSDYGKGMLTRRLLQEIIGAAKRAGKPVLVDPKSRDFSLYRGATCVSPNLQELQGASARDLAGEADIVSAARALMEAHDIANILITRSREGMTLVARGGEARQIPARAQEVFDVSGAGDTAVAALALAVAAGADFAEAAQIANLAAGIVVGRLGTAVVTVQDLKTALFMEERSGGAHKILSLAAARAQSEHWRREGKTLGFTNGCFDLMHPGHLALLTAARAQCDKLVVGVNSDASVKRLKGPARPVSGETERALMLASLAAVDLVVVFEEDTPLALIEALEPDVLIKGADYQKSEVVGHEAVEARGGKVVLVPLKEGYSTTRLIQKMA